MSKMSELDIKVKNGERLTLNEAKVVLAAYQAGLLGQPLQTFVTFRRYAEPPLTPLDEAKALIAADTRQALELDQARATISTQAETIGWWQRQHAVDMKIVTNLHSEMVLLNKRLAIAIPYVEEALSDAAHNNSINLYHPVTAQTCYLNQKLIDAEYDLAVVKGITNPVPKQT